MSDFIYLASQSPRRSQLLDQIGVAHTLLLAGSEEDAESLENVRGAEAPARYVARVTGLKLDAAVQRLQRQGLPEAPVLCADTTVCLGRDILGKPTDEDDALRILKLLSGQTHRVLTAVAVQKGHRRVSALSASWVRFAPMTTTQIKAYVATGESMGKAGAYGVQGRAAVHIEQIRGSYSGIMGLPLFETASLLRTLGIRC
jgi:septum formation protein